jgi:hypothetical protein
MPRRQYAVIAEDGDDVSTSGDLAAEHDGERIMASASAAGGWDAAQVEQWLQDGDGGGETARARGAALASAAAARRVDGAMLRHLQKADWLDLGAADGIEAARLVTAPPRSSDP